MKTTIIEKIQQFFENEKVNQKFLQKIFFENIYDITDKYIPDVQKKEYELWLEYFLLMNYSSKRINTIDNLLDSHFIELRLDLLESNELENFIMRILDAAAILEIFEKHLEFDEQSFISKVEPLTLDLIKIINHEIQKL
jgi:hypothetical protein